MVELEAAKLDDIFHALADPTRRSMIAALAQGEQTVGQLAAPLDMSLAAASKHVKALERANLIGREIRWRTHVCKLNPGALSTAYAWLGHYERFWNDRLDVLEQLLRDEAQAPGESTHTAKDKT